MGSIWHNGCQEATRRGGCGAEEQGGVHEEDTPVGRYTPVGLWFPWHCQHQDSKPGATGGQVPAQIKQVESSQVLLRLLGIHMWPRPRAA